MMLQHFVDYCSLSIFTSVLRVYGVRSTHGVTSHVFLNSIGRQSCTLLGPVCFLVLDHIGITSFTPLFVETLSIYLLYYKYHCPE
jgi:hypothetical protein